MDRLELLQMILKKRHMNRQDLIRELRAAGRTTAYVEALYKNTGETESIFRDIEVVLGLKKGTLYDERKPRKSEFVIADEEDTDKS